MKKIAVLGTDCTIMSVSANLETPEHVLVGSEESYLEFTEPRKLFRPKKYIPPYVRETPKIGRNEPCPCGCGKKYKKCSNKP